MKNRVIKFRTWSLSAHKWLYPIFDISNDLNSYPIQPVQQFTGILDKNGKEIYEGDILSFPTSNWLNQTVEVVWYEKQHCWALKNKRGIQHTTSGGRSYLINGKDLEIIGNIHENPELMQ